MPGFQSNDIFFSDNEMLTINYVIDPQHTLDYGQTVKVIIPVNLLYYGKSADETTTSQQYNVMSFFEFDIDIPGIQSRTLAAAACVVSLLCTIHRHSARHTAGDICVCLCRVHGGAGSGVGRHRRLSDHVQLGARQRHQLQPRAPPRHLGLDAGRSRHALQRARVPPGSDVTIASYAVL